MIGKDGEDPSEGSGGKSKTYSKTSKKSTPVIERLYQRSNEDFFISVVNLVSGLTAGKKKAREKKQKQDRNKELLQSLANLLG